MTAKCLLCGKTGWTSAVTYRDGWICKQCDDDTTAEAMMPTAKQFARVFGSADEALANLERAIDELERAVVEAKERIARLEQRIERLEKGIKQVRL